MSDIVIQIPPALSAVIITLPDGSTLNPTAPTITPPVVVQPPGLLGPVGPQGIPGTPGIDGADGADGLPGIAGVNGIDGLPGAVGPAGPVGLAGPVGPKGDPGTPGAKGDQGIPGSVGPAGPKGDAGNPGIAGTPGVKGDQGIPGEKGDTGPAGPKGDTGATGAPGAGGAGRPSAVLIGSRASAGNLDIACPYPLSILRTLAANSTCTIGVYLSDAARTGDATRLDTTPTAPPTTNPPAVQVTTTDTARAYGINEALTGSTLYVRVTAAADLTLNVEEA